MYSYIKWERSTVSGVKGCKFKINLEMPKLSFLRSMPARPHAQYYIYGEPHTYTCWPLNPRSTEWGCWLQGCHGGRGNFHFQNLYFHLEILTYLGMDFSLRISLGVLKFSFKWKSNRGWEEEPVKFLFRSSQNLWLNLQLHAGVQGLLASKSPCTQVPRLKTPLLEAFNILQIKIEFSFSLKPHCAVKGTGHFKII